MSETEEEATEAPFVMGESVTPPTEVEWSVHERASEFVEVEIHRNDRIVNLRLLLKPDGAEELANSIYKEAEAVRGLE